MEATKPSLRERLSASDYLNRLFDLYPHLELPDAENADLQLRQVLESLAGIPADQLTDVTALRAFLLEQKARFVVAWAVADLTDALSMAELGTAQTRLAELSIQIALRAAWQQPVHSGYLAEMPAPDADAPGLFILGLGKLGGGDLNFSSDIDLIAFFERGSFPVSPMHGPGDIAARILKWLTRFLEDDTGQGFLWRVDWRLRPEASATQLAMPVGAALEYYYFRSMPWHRLAMMKARPVAGDLALGQRFMQDMERFIWRQNLDFRALDELAALKEKIDLEHPGLKRQRAQSQLVSTEPDGFNLKLGTGGIREIEFFANALQLIWGGKRPRLRVTHTVTALQILAEEGLVAPELAQQFSDTYWWLRRQENHVQLLANQQTHSLPTNLQAREKFSCLADIRDWEEFAGELHRRRTQVRAQFSSLFRAQDSLDDTATAEPVQWSGLTEVSQDIVDMWEQGFRGYGLTASQSVGLDSLYRKLGESILEAGRDANESVQRLHAYFLRLPPGGQYFRLLQSSPGLVDGLILPLLYSPPMRTLLEQTPHIIDALLERDREVEGRDAFVFHSADYETRLERMRRLVNEQLYRYYLDFLNRQLGAEELLNTLTDLAEYALDMALRVVSEKLNLDRPPICIIGLGKLGMGLVAPLSDLDILYVSNAGTSLDQANRYVHRLQTALAASMKEGVVYEMDTRLRPSGRSGPPTVSLESFAHYQLERAKTWEHQALVTARPIKGDTETAARMMEIRRATLTRRRSTHQLVMDARKMLERLRAQRIHGHSDRVISTKLRKGGLMEAEYLVSFTVLLRGADMPHLAELDYPELVAAVALELQLEMLPEILRFWRVLQIWERLLGLEGLDVDELPSHFCSTILDQLGVESTTELATRTGLYCAQISTSLDTMLALPPEDESALAAWAEQPIKWQ